MMLRALIVEQLDVDGTLRTFKMEPLGEADKIVVAFPEDYQEPRKGPFHFLNKADADRFSAGFASCSARKLGSSKFRQSGNNFRVELDWAGIPTQANWLSYYALSLPLHAVPVHLAIHNPRAQRHNYLRHVTRDDDRQRYVVFLECSSSEGRFDFHLTCEFQIDPQGFLTSVYSDPQTQPEEPMWDAWAYPLSNAENKRVQQFFVENLHIGDAYSASQAGAIGPHAAASHMGFNQVAVSGRDTFGNEQTEGTEHAPLAKFTRKRAHRSKIQRLTVVLMDSTLPEVVYDPNTRAQGGTNSDDITDILSDLPITLIKETTSLLWRRDEQVLRLNPDLIVMHFSAFYSQTTPDDCDKRLEEFLNYLSAAKACFLLYSRVTTEELHWLGNWLQHIQSRTPALQDRLQILAIEPGPAATFRNPALARRLKMRVKELLNL